MGTTKALVPFNGTPLVLRLAEVCTTAGAERVIVMVADVAATGAFSLQVARRVFQVLAHNPSVQLCPGKTRGAPIDTIRAGLRQVLPGHAVLLWPVDCPAADATLCRALIRAAGARGISVPCRAGRRGHPVVFGCKAARALLGADADDGARGVVRGGAHPVTLVTTRLPVDLNVNTTLDVARLFGMGLR